jgi:hypothetical protein
MAFLEYSGPCRHSAVGRDRTGNLKLAIGLPRQKDRLGELLDQVLVARSEMLGLNGHHDLAKNIADLRASIIAWFNRLCRVSTAGKTANSALDFRGIFYTPMMPLGATAT